MSQDLGPPSGGSGISEGILIPSRSPNCHPNAGWSTQLGHAACALCGRVYESSAELACSETAGYDLAAPASSPDAKAQLYEAALAIMLESDSTTMKERMTHWHHLSSAFWHYQHVLWEDAKAADYWSPRWAAQRSFSLGIIARKAPRASVTNDALSLEDLGL
jgi:hypothetical protein